MDGLEDTLKVWGGLFADRLNVSEEEVAERKVDFRKTFEEETAKADAKRKQAQLEASQKAYTQLADGIYERATKSIANKKDLKMVELLLMNGKSDDAEELVAEAEGETPKAPEPKGSTESDEQIFERIARKKGLLKGEPLQAGGKARTPQEIVAAYAAGEISEEEYAKIRDKLPPTIED